MSACPGSWTPHHCGMGGAAGVHLNASRRLGGASHILYPVATAPATARRAPHLLRSFGWFWGLLGSEHCHHASCTAPMPPRNEQVLSWQVPPSPQVATLTAPGGKGGGLRERVGGREEQSAEPCQLNHSAERVGYLCHSKLWMAATARLDPPGQ